MPEAMLIGTDDARWCDTIARIHHDTYHLPEYMEVSARLQGGAARGILVRSAGESLLVPLLVRALPAELGIDGVDGASPYGYAGPIITQRLHHDPDRCANFFRAAFEAARQEGFASLFLRLHPLLPLPTEVLADVGSLVEHGPVTYIDLIRPEEEARQEQRAEHRRVIGRLLEEGYGARMDDWDRWGDFIRLYEATMRRVHANPFYIFPHVYYEDLRASLGDHLHLCTVTAPGGETAAASLFMEEDGIVQYHLSGDDPAMRSAGATRLIFHEAPRWARLRGNRVMHLGGGLGGRADSLYRFKRGWSNLTSRFRSLRVVLDHAVYDGAVEAWRGVTGAMSPDSVADFFPAYRAPAPASVGANRS